MTTTAGIESAEAPPSGWTAGPVPLPADDVLPPPPPPLRPPPPPGTPGTTRPPAIAALATAATVGLYLPWLLAEQFVDLAVYRGHGLKRRWGLLLGVVGAGAYLLPAEVDGVCRVEDRPTPVTFRLGFLMTSPIVAWLVFSVKSLWAAPTVLNDHLDTVKLGLIGLIFLGWMAYAALLQRAMNTFWIDRGAEAPPWGAARPAPAADMASPGLETLLPPPPAWVGATLPPSPPVIPLLPAPADPLPVVPPEPADLLPPAEAPTEPPPDAKPADADQPPAGTEPEQPTPTAD